MKKKTLSLALALALCLGLTVPATAAEPDITWLPVSFPETMLWGDLLVAENSRYKWGVVDFSGEVVIPLQCDYFERIGDWLGFDWTDENGNVRSAFLNRTGEILTPDGTGYDVVHPCFDGLALVGKRGTDGYLKYGYIDEAGVEVIPLVHDRAFDFSEGLAAVVEGRYSDAKNGFIDKTGKMVISPEYDGAGSFSDGLAMVVKGKFGNTKYGFIDKTGKVVIPPEYDDAWDFSGGLARVGKQNAYGEEKYGFVDTTGQVVVPLEYDRVYDFSEGLALVMKRGEDWSEKYGYVDTAGKVVVPPEYDRAYDFSEGLARVYKNGKCGFIDKTGQLVLPLVYDWYSSWIYRGGEINNFSGGLALALENGKYGFIDKTGQMAVPPEYDEVGCFSDGRAFVQKDGKWGILNIQPVQPETLETPEAPQAQPTLSQVTMDGTPVNFATYALPEGEGVVNYIRVRDLAVLLNGTAAQFDVVWDGKANLVTGTPYTGSSDAAPFSTPMAYEKLSDPTYVNGVPLNLEAIRITYDGAGYTYYKLRDLAEALGFNIGWTLQTGIFVETNKPYDPAN